MEEPVLAGAPAVGSPESSGSTVPRRMRAASDARLVELIRADDAAAFEVLYDRHHAAILGFARQMLGDAQEAEDAVQQTFLSAYRDLRSHDRPVNPRPWLFTIARNRCLTLLRSRHECATELVAEPSTDGLALQVQRRQELRELIGDIRQLPGEQRAALVLAELDALSHAQIGDVLGVPPAKVKALVFQARSALSASRTARETSCLEIRMVLATAHGGPLRRANLRRHLSECSGCRDFRREIERERLLGV